MKRRNRTAWVILVAAGCAPLAAAQEKRQKTYEEIVNAPVVLKVPGTRDVKVRADLRYSEADPHLFMDVFSPPATRATDRHPVVMFIHGGAGSESRPKDWGLYKSWGRTVAASGFTAVTFNHRLGYPDPLLQESATDVAAAIDYVRAHAREWNADDDRICLAAFSAGGPMLTLGFDPKRPYVRCLIGFYAFMDIQQTGLHSKYEPAERVRAFSPIEHLGDEYARSVPMFIGRGGLDEIPTMNDSIDRYIARAIEKNANLVVWNHPQGTHTFDNQNDDDRSREIIAAALEFMRRHLKS
ncbi:MAG TPA: alpha/beta hydrolase [Steroidobacteraceae bacterium]|nr:alpha/beta hydrolase [Steroidobacteraceae bacterium]